jgi:uncharacterized protein with GYD domain
VPTYISLIRYTQKGLESIKDSPERLDAGRKAFQSQGGTVKAFYLTMGQYDGVLIGEAPNDEVVAKLALSLGGQGNVRTETLRAFTEDEFRKLVSEVP